MAAEETDITATSPSRKRQKLNQVRLQSVLPDELIADIKSILVYIATIKDPKTISTAIVELNEKIPILELQHLKRIKSRDIILCLSSWIHSNNPDHIDNEHDKNLPLNSELVLHYLSSKGLTDEFIKHFDVTSFQRVFVPLHSPKTRKQYTVANGIWPCNFHSNKYLENLVENTLFSPKELEIHAKFLHLAQEISKLSPTIVGNNSTGSCHNDCGVVIIDSLRGDLIISGGFSMTSKNPILHGPMVAIEGVARTQNGGAYKDDGFDIRWKELLTGQFGEFTVLQRSYNSNSKNNKHKSTLNKDDKIRHSSSAIDALSASVDVNNELVDNLNESEYLCTNYHVYMTHEPCAMCAMALIHSRAKRIFYLHPTNNGALGTTCKIHTVKDLNHHYEVFQVHPDDIVCFMK